MNKVVDGIRELLKSRKVSNIEHFFHEYHDRYLIDDSFSDLEVLFITIHLLETLKQRAGADYYDCKEVFTFFGRKEDNFRKIVHLAKKQQFIEEKIESEGNTKRKQLYFLVKGLKKWQVLSGQIGKLPVYIIKSGEYYSAIKIFEDFLMDEICNSKEGEIFLCDPYISPVTLHPFSVLKNKIASIKILTSNILEEEKLKNYIKKFQKECNIIVEVRLSKKIHDRYIIYSEKCWSIGSSIKDLGNKDTLIKDISEVAQSLSSLFRERWDEAEVVI